MTPTTPTAAFRLGEKTQDPLQMYLIDIAGIVKGAHKGEGLGNQFLSHIRRATQHMGVLIDELLAAFVIGIDFIVTLVERRLLVWRPVAAETRT